MIQRTLHGALQALVRRDLQPAMTAVEQDDEVAHVHKSLHQERPEFVRRDPTLASQAIRLLTVGVALERMADHVANTGDRTWYTEMGQLKELHERHYASGLLS